MSNFYVRSLQSLKEKILLEDVKYVKVFSRLSFQQKATFIGDITNINETVQLKSCFHLTILNNDYRACAESLSHSYFMPLFVSVVREGSTCAPKLGRIENVLGYWEFT